MSDQAARLPPSVEWRDGALILLDQRRLPLEVRYRRLTRVEEVWEAIKQLEVRGAPAIGIAAGFGIALWALDAEADSPQSLLEGLERTRVYLESSRPTAVNLAWAVRRIFRACQSEPSVAAIRARALLEAQAIQAEDAEACRKIGEHGLALLPAGATVMTICNAGAIATARYGTALAPFHLARERGLELSVIACETRPLLQGARLTTWELASIGIDVTLITDSMAAHVMKTRRIDAVIVGADRIARNGDSANKIGTYGLALLARAHGIPFYVAAPFSTIDFELADGSGIPIEERDEKEIVEIQGQRIAPEGIKVFNPAFDVTPNELIEGLITERGVIRCAELDCHQARAMG
ncbi:S-methyl-5-thioribose-1-phosphate isomerase [Halotalea alkalilenta]|uniref:Methylthioribose-1-phosphate isomerase n=1 Tax=Halotalea alkalilenta TaxID=376489 RepID=A0A172YAR8_9GAMM|nr:S-methyl-5-thioribose-1-phosphate isomerase [Halotalea alkalilenta]ANF56202.1 S-methyl-5-thioribose-1-phosphate isomerase [Halotalea alkalilenta]